MLRDTLFVVRNHMQNLPRTLMHGSFPAVQAQKDFRLSVPNALVSSRSLLNNLSGIWAWDRNRGNLREVFQTGSAIGNQTKVEQAKNSNSLITADH